MVALLKCSSNHARNFSIVQAATMSSTANYGTTIAATTQ